jgi:hypothetical protein
LFHRAVKAHADGVEYVLSHFDKRLPAFTLKAPAGTVGELACGEITHIHSSDNSKQMVMNATDAVTAIQLG